MRGDDFLLNQNLAADGALLALGQAGLGVRGRNRRENLLDVAGRGNFFLLHQNLAANGAVLAFGQTGLGAGSGLALVDNLGVAERGNLFLLHQNLAANGAVLAFGQTKVQEIDKPLGHDWDDGELKDADCEKAERVVYTCERCGEVKEEIIPNGEAAKGHKFVDKIVAPTCKTKGYTERTCERCDLYEKINETEIDKDAHVAKLDKTIREATCTVNGLGRYTCELCGEYLGYRAIEAKHVYGAPIFDEGKEATCGKDGYGYYVCTVCGEKSEKTEIPATGKHQFVDEFVIDATCEEPMKVGRICKVCGKVDGEVKTVGEKLGHDWDDGELKDADCEKAERVVYTCKRCGETKEDVIGTEVLGHKYKEKVVEPTCKTKGYKAYVCSVCGDAEVIEELEPVAGNHVAKLDKVIREATCSANGLGRYVCAECGDYIGYRAIVAEHKWGEEYANANATAIMHECQVCGKVEIIWQDPDFKECEEGKHEIVNDPARAATCTVNGLTAGKHCVVCGKILAQQTVIPALGHTEVVDEGKEATCTEAAVRLAANLADAANLFRLGAGCRNHGFVHELVLAGRGDNVLFGLFAADGADVVAVAVLAAGGFLALVEDRRAVNVLRFDRPVAEVLAAQLAGVAAKAVHRAGRFADGLVQLRDVRVLVDFGLVDLLIEIASLAGALGVALRLAGRGNDLVDELVTLRSFAVRDDFFLHFAAALAGVHDALRLLAVSVLQLAVVPVMAEGFVDFLNLAVRLAASPARDRRAHHGRHHRAHVQGRG